MTDPQKPTDEEAKAAADAQAKLDAEAQAKAEADAKKAEQKARKASAAVRSEDVPGGQYIVNGKLVDANGKPIGAKAADGE